MVRKPEHSNSYSVLFPCHRQLDMLLDKNGGFPVPAGKAHQHY